MTKETRKKTEKGSSESQIPRKRRMGCGIALCAAAVPIVLIAIQRPPLPPWVPPYAYTAIMLLEAMVLIGLGIGLWRGHLWAYWGFIGFFGFCIILVLGVGVAVGVSTGFSSELAGGLAAGVLQALFLIAAAYFLRPRPIQCQSQSAPDDTGTMDPDDS